MLICYYSNECHVVQTEAHILVKDDEKDLWLSFKLIEENPFCFAVILIIGSTISFMSCILQYSDGCCPR